MVVVGRSVVVVVVVVVVLVVVVVALALAREVGLEEEEPADPAGHTTFSG